MKLWNITPITSAVFAFTLAAAACGSAEQDVRADADPLLRRFAPAEIAAPAEMAAPAPDPILEAPSEIAEPIATPGPIADAPVITPFPDSFCDPTNLETFLIQCDPVMVDAIDGPAAG